MSLRPILRKRTMNVKDENANNMVTSADLLRHCRKVTFGDELEETCERQKEEETCTNKGDNSPAEQTTEGQSGDRCDMDKINMLLQCGFDEDDNNNDDNGNDVGFPRLCVEPGVEFGVETGTNKGDNSSVEQTTEGQSGDRCVMDKINMLLQCGFDDDNNNDDNGNDVGFPRLCVEPGVEFGRRGKAEGELQDATDIQYLGTGEILVTDLINSRLQVFDEEGNVKRTLHSEHILEPWASALTSDGRHVAVTSRRQRKVALLSTTEEEGEGEGGSFSGSIGEGSLSCPSGLAVTSRGEFIVTDIHTHRVNVFDADGTFLTALGAGSVTFNQPRYVTVSRHGDVIVSDSGNHRLVVFSRDWKFVRTVGGFGKEDGRFKFPHAVCTDTAGNIIVCDRYNNRVSVFTRRGQFVRHLVTSEDQLRHPQGLALSPQMDLYVSHGGLKAHCVRVLHISLRGS